MSQALHRLLTLVALVLAATIATPAAAAASDVQTAWRLLDYIAVDYREAVQGGRVVNQLEYDEMVEFSASVGERLQALPAKPARAALIRDASELQKAIAAKAAPEAIDRQARALAAQLLAAYPVPLAPAQVPDVARGAALYAQNCASCHGARGDADVPVARTIDPPPIAFTDRARAAERSPFALYQVIDQGLEGTAMASFGDLPPADKWALAFHSGRFAYPPALAATGKRLWETDPALRRRIPDLAALASLTPAALGREIGADEAAAVIAFLRGNPGTLATPASANTLAIARERLQQSLAAYEAGDRDQAKTLALSAYLDGFEPVEPVLAARDAALMASVEQAMAELRSAIGARRPAAEVRDRVDALDALFAQTEEALAPDRASAASAFAGAFAIILREGLEALLIVVAMLAFLGKADRPEMTRPVHAGWMAALAAGALTWWAATSLIGISGASRELTEGFGSLLAAAVLVFVGIWMHGKAQAGEWQRYIRARLGHALSRGSGWFLFALAFVAVYREVFETILFFAAMAAQGEVEALVAGGLTGAVLLAVIAVAMLRFSKKLPIGKFFAYSAALVAVLAVVLAGKGVAALQEAGWVGVSPWGSLRAPLLGVYPTLQGIATQLAVVLILILGFAWNRREARLAAA